MTDDTWLAQMIEAIQKVRRYGARGRSTFFADEDTQQLVIHNIEQPVEAADHLSRGFKQANSSIDWTSLRHLRTRLIHEYTKVSPDQVWTFLREEMPGLERRLLAVRARGARGRSSKGRPSADANVE